MTARAIASAAGATAGAALISGVATAAALAVAARALGPEAFASLAGFWSLGYALTAALLAPLEQEVARRVAAGAAPGGAVLVLRRPGALVLGVAAVAALGLGGPASDPALAGLLVALVVANAGVLVARGVLAGGGRTGAYAASTAGEGVVRLAGCALVAHVGSGGARAYAVAVVAATAAWAPALVRRHRTAPSSPPSADPGPAGRSLTLLTLGSVGAALFAQGLPAVAALLAGAGEEADVGRLATALTVATVPAFLLAGAVPVLLPAVVRAASGGDRAAVRRLVVGSVVVAGGAGAVAGTALVVAGGAVLRMVLGPGYALDRATLAGLAAVGLGLLVAGVLTPTAVALARDRAVARGWVGGTLAFAAVVAAGRLVGSGTVGVVVSGAVVGLAAASVALGIAVRQAVTTSAGHGASEPTSAPSLPPVPA